jgi:uncharacterized membrane protein
MFVLIAIIYVLIPIVIAIICFKGFLNTQVHGEAIYNFWYGFTFLSRLFEFNFVVRKFALQEAIYFRSVKLEHGDNPEKIKEILREEMIQNIR